MLNEKKSQNVLDMYAVEDLAKGRVSLEVMQYLLRKGGPGSGVKGHKTSKDQENKLRKEYSDLVEEVDHLTLKRKQFPDNKDRYNKEIKKLEGKQDKVLSDLKALRSRKINPSHIKDTVRDGMKQNKENLN